MTAFLIALAMSQVIRITFYIFTILNKSRKFAAKDSNLSYGLTFVIVAFVFWLLSGASFVQTLILFMVSIWGLRLAGYSFSRVIKNNKEIRFMDHITKAVSSWIILWPTLFIMNYLQSMPLSVFTWAGVLVWLIGITIESVADFQKAVFKTIPENKDKWTNTGLWTYSRHPNYFGELACWWGIFIIALPFLSGIWWFVIIGPVYLSVLLLFVTGIPPLEKKYQEKYSANPDFQRYRAQTSLLIPWFRKKF